MNIPSRLLLGAALVAAGTAGLAQPATAAPPTNCSAVVTTLEYASGYVVAEKLRFCDDGTVIENSTSVQKLNPSTGTWVTVASGAPAVYKCQGSAVNRFRVGGSSTTVGTKYPCG